MLYHQMLMQSITSANWDKWDGTADGLAVMFESGTAIYISACVLSESKVLVAYQDSGNSSFGTACVLTISGKVVTAGTPTVFRGVGVAYISVCKLSETKALVSYSDITGLYYGRANVLTISGTTIAVGATIAFAGNTTDYVSMCALSDTAALVAYRNGDNSCYGTACVLTVSGDTITTGPAVVFGGYSTEISVCVVSTGKVLVAYRDGNNSYYGTARILSISGIYITVGPLATFCAVSPLYTTTCNLSGDTAMVAYSNLNNARYGTACTLSISGTAITPWAPVTFNSSRTDVMSICRLSNAKCLISYKDVANSYYGTSRILSVSNNITTVGAPVIFNSTTTDYPYACLLSDSAVLQAYGSGGSGNGTAKVLNGA